MDSAKNQLDSANKSYQAIRNIFFSRCYEKAGSQAQAESLSVNFYETDPLARHLPKVSDEAFKGQGHRSWCREFLRTEMKGDYSEWDASQKIEKAHDAINLAKSDLLSEKEMYNTIINKYTYTLGGAMVGLAVTGFFAKKTIQQLATLKTCREDSAAALTKKVIKTLGIATLTATGVVVTAALWNEAMITNHGLSDPQFV